MIKTIRIIYALIFTISIISCQTEQPLENGKKENDIAKEVDFKITSIENDVNKETGDNSFLINFEYEKSSKTIKVFQIDDKNFAYDFNLDGKSDLKLQLDTKNNQAKYLTNGGEVIGYGRIESNLDNSTQTLYLNSILDSGKNEYDEGWSECFESAAGSPEGITAAVISGFFGPGATAGLYGGFAIGCAVLNA